LEGLLSEELGPDENAACKEIEARMLQNVKGHPKQHELEDFIIAASLITDGSIVDKQLAELLKVSVGEVRNRRKMLLRIASVSQLGLSLLGGRHEKQEQKA
jgi:hypothetical protein